MSDASSPEDPTERPLHWLGRKEEMVLNVNNNDKHQRQQDKRK